MDTQELDDIRLLLTEVVDELGPDQVTTTLIAPPPAGNTRTTWT